MDLFENDLFDNTPVPLVDGAVLLRGFVQKNNAALQKIGRAHV